MPDARTQGVVCSSAVEQNIVRTNEEDFMSLHFQWLSFDASVFYITEDPLNISL